ncbi:CLUMA_CG016795, isoform A [Clunio marinus]|uniref:CLUMA_CG016795, isoform A n=1 Tax=Clunio marinus TaxID=568069 RepID=A0A1J1IVY0_9DIPT|nr:CLUMA_CG016795, isoform A [Clunio marinus]
MSLTLVEISQFEIFLLTLLMFLDEGKVFADKKLRRNRQLHSEAIFCFLTMLTVILTLQAILDVVEDNNRHQNQKFFNP